MTDIEMIFRRKPYKIRVEKGMDSLVYTEGGKSLTLGCGFSATKPTEVGIYTNNIHTWDFSSEVISEEERNRILENVKRYFETGLVRYSIVFIGDWKASDKNNPNKPSGISA